VIAAVRVLYACDDPNAVERLRRLGVKVEVADFDPPTELLEAAGIPLPDWAAGGGKKPFEVVVQAPAEEFPEVVECRAISYSVEVACETEECVARAASVLARRGASVYRRGMTVYGFGEGDAGKIIPELIGGISHP